MKDKSSLKYFFKNNRFLFLKMALYIVVLALVFLILTLFVRRLLPVFFWVIVVGIAFAFIEIDTLVDYLKAKNDIKKK